MSITGPSLPSWYSQAFQEIEKSSENQSKAVIQALEAIRANQPIESKGLNKTNRKILKDLDAKVKEAPQPVKQLIDLDLQERIKTLFNRSLDKEKTKGQEKATFNILLEQEDVLRHVFSFGDKKMKDTLSTTSKHVKAIVDKEWDRQLVALLKAKDRTSFSQNLKFFFKKLFSTPEFPSLCFSKDFDIEKVPIRELEPYLPKNINYVQILKNLFQHGSSIKIGSDEEKFVLYLMKNVPWSPRDVFKGDWPNNDSPIVKIAVDASQFLVEASKPPFDQEKPDLSNKLNNSELVHYPCACTGVDFLITGFSLCEWAVLVLTKDLYTNEAKVALLAAEARSGVGQTLLKNLSPELKDNKKVVIALVRQEGENLQFASPRLQMDQEVVFAAMVSKLTALKHAHPDIQKDKQFIIRFFKLTRKIGSGELSLLKLLPKELQDDEDVVEAAVRWSLQEFKHASDRLKTDKNFILKLAQIDGKVIENIPEAQGDKTIGLAAVKSNLFAFSLLSDELKKDPEIIEALMQHKMGRLLL